MDRDIALKIVTAITDINGVLDTLVANTAPSNQNRNVDPDTRNAEITEEPEARTETVPDQEPEPERETVPDPEPETKTTTRKK